MLSFHHNFTTPCGDTSENCVRLSCNMYVVRRQGLHTFALGSAVMFQQSLTHARHYLTAVITLTDTRAHRRVTYPTCFLRRSMVFCLSKVSVAICLVRSQTRRVYLCLVLELERSADACARRGAVHSINVHVRVHVFESEQTEHTERTHTHAQNFTFMVVVIVCY